MHKPYILVLATVLFNVAVSFASNKLDSIGVENNQGKKLIVHKIEAKETYYAIGKRYNVNYKDIILYNENKPLHVGVIIKIPTNIPFVGVPVKGDTESSIGYFTYTIKAKDNLNMLAEKYGTTVNEIKRVNNLSSINLQIGQVLKIPSGTAAAQEETDAPAKTVVDQKTAISSDGQTIEHTVRPKENLNLLAEKYGTSIDEIKRINRLSSSNLSIGQVLKIPVKVAEQEAQTAAVPSQKNYTKPSVQASKLPDGSFEYVVGAGETIYSIAKKYNLTTYQIKTVNNLTSNEVVAGQKLILPGSPNIKTEVINPVIDATQKDSDKQQAQTSNVASGNFEHIVVAGETIYSIAKKYNLTTYQLKTANKLQENEVVVGQKLIIIGPRSVAASDGEDIAGSDNTIKDPSLRGAPSAYGIIQKEEKGTAVWISDADLDPTKMLVLHRTAPVGTIIKVTNPMSNRSAFAKVVGKFTENETTKDVIIVMTKAVADAVGALDKRFFCNLTYGAQENEQ